MDFAFTADQKKWLELAQELGEEFEPRARKYDEEAAYPAENFRRLFETGILNLAVPQAYGGTGSEAGNSGYLPYMVAEVLARYCPTTSWDLLIHWHQVGIIARLGNEEQKQRFLGDSVKRGVVMGSLGTEINPMQFSAGATAATMPVFESELKPVPGGFLANGTKHFCSMAPASEYLTFWALAPGAKGNSDGVSQAIIPSKSPGLTFAANGWDECIGLRGSVSWSVILKDVFIPWENVIGQPGDFIQKDPYTFELSHAAHLIGCSQGLMDFLIKFLQARPYLLNDDTNVQLLANMDSAMQAMRTSFWYTIWMWEQKNYEEATLASLRLLQTSKQTSHFIGGRAFDICGTRALFKFNPVERFWRDIRTSSLHTRQSQMNRLLTEGMMNGGRLFPKKKFGNKLDKVKTWSELGVVLDKAGGPARAAV